MHQIIPAQSQYTYDCLTDVTSGTMTFFVSFSALTAIPAGGSLLEMVGSVGASGLYLSTVALGGLSFYIARSLLIGKFLVFRSNI